MKYIILIIICLILTQCVYQKPIVCIKFNYKNSNLEYRKNNIYIKKNEYLYFSIISMNIKRCTVYKKYQNDTLVVKTILKNHRVIPILDGKGIAIFYRVEYNDNKIKSKYKLITYGQRGCRTLIDKKIIYNENGNEIQYDLRNTDNYKLY